MENVVHAGLKHLAFQQVAFRVDYTSPQLNVFDVETESQSQLREKRFRFDGAPLCFQRMMHSKPETMENVLSMPSSRSQNKVRISADLSFEDAFHLLLGRLVHAIARLDFHVGLQLRYWGSDKDTKIQSLLKPKTAKLDERLKALECLMRAAWMNTVVEGQQEFSLWFECAHRTRVFRNDYSHGRWGVPGKHLPGESGRFCDATPLLVFVPLNWDLSPSREDESIAMTLDEFAAQVGEAEQLSGQFQDLATKYGEHLHVGKRLNSSSR